MKTISLLYYTMRIIS